MITRLKIKNFKSHKNTDLEFGNLTLLTGLNSSGKSSVIQVFLLLRQSFIKNRLDKGLDLNEPLCDIGKVENALYKYAGDDIISFGIEKNSKNYSFDFNTRDKLEDSFIPKNDSSVDFEENFSFFTNNFQYLSANRLASVEFYPIDSYAVENEKQLSLKYGQGELVAHFLEHYGSHRDFNIDLELLLHPLEKSRKLIDQVIAWEREISPRLTISTKKIADKITFEFGYKSDSEKINPLKNINAKNVGFGISYSLSIVVALLSASPGSIIFIENPEAHLHPKGQSKMAELLCLAAKSGIQVVVETHSDHIFNGIRKAIKAKKIKKEEVKVHFFEIDKANTTQATCINFSESGRMFNTVDGLFDQFDNDLDELIGLL